MKYLFNITCQDGGHGWGSTGQKGTFVVDAPHEDAAKIHLGEYMPGGWTAQLVGETTRPTGITSTGGHHDA